LLTTLLVGTELVMNADTNMVTNTAIRMRFQEWVTKMSLNPTALKRFMATTVKVCTKASMPAMMPAFALDLATAITIITGSSKISSGMMRDERWSVDLGANRI
jgi:hypothetical protein